MQIVKHTIKTLATPFQIWKVWEDVDNWKRWDQEIELSQLHGSFKTGTAGVTKFIKTPLFKTLLTEVKPFEKVTQEAYLFFAKVISYQSMTQTADATQVTFEVEIKGPLSLFYALMIGRFIKKKIPTEMQMMLHCIPSHT